VGGGMAENKRCGARKKTGELCKKWPVKGKKRCKFHGGLSTGAPKGNKNALKHGQYETIWLDTLEPEEVDMFEEMAVDALKQLTDDIKLINIRIRRMMKRIQDLKEDELVEVSYSYTTGLVAEGPIETETTTKEHGLKHIMLIEESLTRLQKEKAKLIEIKHRIEDGGKDGKESEDWVAAIQAVADKRKLNGKKAKK
jgi:uncharacterized protein YjcR